jgi:hypothetical protein
MQSHLRLRSSLVAGLSLALGISALALAPTAAQAQALPGPRDFVSGLDLECYRTPGPPLDLNLNLTHLNPVLLGLGLPAHAVIVRELAQTCVPVRKNNVNPSAAALPFISRVDFACFRVDAAPLANPIELDLTHLNPVLAGLPQHKIRLVRPAQLCVPVAKNNVLPADNVLQLVRFLDLECWETEPGAHPNFTVWLGQLNPLLAAIAPHAMTLGPTPRQLCVPVRKNNQAIPAAALAIIRWTDLEKFAAEPSVFIAPVNLLLRHLNPLLANLPQMPVVLQEANSLMVPVAKNGMVPPIN